jgi:uncharacterized membrane protein YfhO
VDGEPAVVHQVNYLMQGVWLEPGGHRVELRFFPDSLRKGILVSLFFALFLLVLAGWLFANRRLLSRTPGEHVCRGADRERPIIS